MKCFYMFDELKAKYNWKPIRHCPGRYILSTGITHLSPEQLVGKALLITEETFQTAKDPVLYCHFEGGGLISYRKKEGYLHTLCDTDGMNRKMISLKGENR